MSSVRTNSTGRTPVRFSSDVSSRRTASFQSSSGWNTARASYPQSLSSSAFAVGEFAGIIGEEAASIIVGVLRRW
jgi:hypothetical protein